MKTAIHYMMVNRYQLAPYSPTHFKMIMKFDKAKQKRASILCLKVRSVKHLDHPLPWFRYSLRIISAIAQAPLFWHGSKTQ